MCSKRKETMKSIRQALLPAILCAAFGPPAIAAAPDTEAVEFYNQKLNHYFVTASAAEARGIDAGAAGAGWSRTGRSFPAWTRQADAPADAQPVCRFYSAGANSHFYTASAGECASLRAQEALERNAGRGVRGWAFEGVAFYVQGPQSGSCAGGTTPLARAYNNGFTNGEGSNHRFIDDPSLMEVMSERGWTVEGTVMCAQAKRSGGNANLPPTATDFTSLAGTWEGDARWKSQNRGRETRAAEPLTLTIAEDGTVAGEGFGCTFEGTMTRGDGFRSHFEASLSASGCTVESFNGEYRFTHLERHDDAVRLLMKRGHGAVEAMIDARLTLGAEPPPPDEPGFGAVEGDWVGTIAWNATQTPTGGTPTAVAVNQALDLAISATGAVTGSGFGCAFTGTLAPAEPEGTFTGTLTASGCTEAIFDGDYAATLVAGDPAGLQVDLSRQFEDATIVIEAQIAGALDPKAP
jgi:hypothetical protein